MAVRGRKPKPTALKVLTGNPGGRPLNQHEPKPRAKAPRCPAWLPKVAKAEWKKLVPELSRLGLLTVVDEVTLAGFCSAVAEFRNAIERLEADGRYYWVGGWAEEIIDEKTGEKKVEWRGGRLKHHPALAQLKSAWQAIKDFSALFGLDPSSRTRISVKGVPMGADDEGDGLKAYIGKKKA